MVAGPRIVFGRWDTGFDEPLLFTVKPDGTDRRPLLSERAEGPRWSPDGSKLSVIATSPQGVLFVSMINRDGSGFQRFDSPDATLNLGCAVWSHDGTRLACAGWDDADPTRNGIYTVRASDGGDLRRVTASPGGGLHDEIGDYSPDGHQMVFLRLTSGDDHHTSVMIANSDGTDARLLLQIDGLTARWSPDGATILTESAGTLMLVPVAGGKMSQIPVHMTPPAIPGPASRPGWSPDGSHIVFSLQDSDSDATDIYTMLRDGTDVVRITNTPQDEEFADWGR
jgi:Tol biopolymer transport system component